MPRGNRNRCTKCGGFLNKAGECKKCGTVKIPPMSSLDALKKLMALLGKMPSDLKGYEAAYYDLVRDGCARGDTYTQSILSPLDIDLF